MSIVREATCSIRAMPPGVCEIEVLMILNDNTDNYNKNKNIL